MILTESQKFLHLDVRKFPTKPAYKCGSVLSSKRRRKMYIIQYYKHEASVGLGIYLCEQTLKVILHWAEMNAKAT